MYATETEQNAFLQPGPSVFTTPAPSFQGQGKRHKSKRQSKYVFLCQLASKG